MTKTGYIYPQSLIRMYRFMCRRPLKTYVVKDFIGIGGNTSNLRKQLNTLKALGLIEQVSAVYEVQLKGVKKGKYSFRRDVIGYRVIRCRIIGGING